MRKETCDKESKYKREYEAEKETRAAFHLEKKRAHVNNFPNR